jgi:hypothetical protein
VPAVYLNREEVLFDFQVPQNLERLGGTGEIQLESLILHIGSDIQGQRPPDLALYDWSAEDWRAIAEPQAGRNVIGDVAGLTDADGTVRVRLEPSNFSGGCFFLAMGLEGSR